MYCPQCAHPDTGCYGTSCVVRDHRFQACRQIFQTHRRRQDPSLKHRVCQLYFQGMGMRATGRVLGIHNDDGVSLKLLIQKLNNA